MSVVDAVCIAICAYWWGEWAADRKAKRRSESESSAFRLLFGMVQAVREKRRMVGPALTITREERFELLGEKFCLALRSDGDPSALVKEDA